MQERECKGCGVEVELEEGVRGWRGYCLSCELQSSKETKAHRRRAREENEPKHPPQEDE